MIHIAICDDEKYMSDHIRAMTSDFFRKKNREIRVRTFAGGEELLKYDGQIDILFLDIQMKDLDGMETARRLRADKFQGFLIFITVLKEMVFRSFEVQAYDYLIKPVEEKQFKNTMERLYASMCNARVGTEEFNRVRIGIGNKPKGWDLADYVLGHFEEEDRDKVEEGVIHACEAVELILKDGISAAMNQYNKKR